MRQSLKNNHAQRAGPRLVSIKLGHCSSFACFHVGIYSISLGVSGRSIRHESRLHYDFCSNHRFRHQLFFFEPGLISLAKNLYMLSTPNSIPSREHLISKFPATKVSLLLDLRDQVADFGILSAETCTPISLYTHPLGCVAMSKCLIAAFWARGWLSLWLPQSPSNSSPASLLSTCNSLDQ